MTKQEPIIYNAVRNTAIHLKWKRELSFIEVIKLANDLIEANNQKIEIIDGFLDEMELMKEALREELQDNGNAYYIRIFDELFDLEYDKWDRNEPNRKWVDWEKILKEKGDVE